MRGYLVLPALEPSIVKSRGWNTKNENNVLVNHVVLLFKYFIYKKRTNKHAINIHALKNYIKFLQKIEQRIARKKIDWKTLYKVGENCTTPQYLMRKSGLLRRLSDIALSVALYD